MTAAAMVAAATSLAGAAPAAAAAGLSISGGGDGHGIGMSQYGALGFALHGWSDTQILSHYYSGTTLGSISPTRTVRVLLGDGSAGFSGATRASGHALSSTTRYTVRADGSSLALYSGSRRVGVYGSPLTVSGPRPLQATGLGTYRGDLVYRPDGSGGVQTVNSLGLDDYVRGVVAAEMPSSWPSAALEAQAIAARTYALTAGAAGSDFDVYSDTRSQEYGGVGAETARTDAAVTATSGRVVDYAGQPAFTPFFASSGGYTESIQNVWLGVTPDAWLHGVADPYDNSGGNPYYRWTLHFSLADAASRLHGLVRGTFEGIVITRHGVSPRVVDAQVIGSRGRTSVTGPQLQQAFGLMSTLVSFTTVAANGARVSSGSLAMSTSAVAAPASTTASKATSATTSGSTASASGGAGLG